MHVCKHLKCKYAAGMYARVCKHIYIRTYVHTHHLGHGLKYQDWGIDHILTPFCLSTVKDGVDILNCAGFNSLLNPG